MTNRFEIVKQIALFLLVCGVALQAWRGLFINGCNITKSLIQLSDVKKSHASLLAENKAMMKEVKDLKAGKGKTKLLASKELNMVKDPDTEVMIKFVD